MKTLERSPSQKWIAGICGGIGKTYEVDPTIVRLVFIFVAIATGLVPLGATYLIAWLIVPIANGPSLLRTLFPGPLPGIPVNGPARKADPAATKGGEA